MAFFRALVLSVVFGVFSQSDPALAKCVQRLVDEATQQIGCNSYDCTLVAVKKESEKLGCTDRSQNPADDCKAYSVKAGKALGCTAEKCDPNYNECEGYTLGCSSKSCEYYENKDHPDNANVDMKCFTKKDDKGNEVKVPVNDSEYDPETQNSQNPARWTLNCWQSGCDWYEDRARMKEEVGCVKDDCRHYYVDTPYVLACTGSVCNDKHHKPAAGYEVGCDRYRCADERITPGWTLACTRRF